MVDKRYVKIGVAAMAALALIIGLAVGISKQQQNKTSVSSFAVESCNNIAGAASDSSNSKTSKSTSTTSTTSSSKSGKSGRRLDRRHLIVPGVENVQSDSGKRKLRNEIVKERVLGKSSKRSKSSGGGGGGSAAKPSSCINVADACDVSAAGGGKSGKSGGPSDVSAAGGGKSGKSGGSDEAAAAGGSGKSGKSGGSDISAAGGGKSGKSGGSDEAAAAGGSGKSGKSGGSGISAAGGGKSGKSGSGANAQSPSTCDTKSSKSTSSSDDPPPVDILSDDIPDFTDDIIPVETLQPSALASEQGTTTVGKELDAENTQAAGRVPFN